MRSMPSNADELDVALLRHLADHPQASQRALARATGVSLGRINHALRALIDKGWVKAGNFIGNPHKPGHAYLLTPGGIEAKLHLTRSFLTSKICEYHRLRVEIQSLQDELEAAPWQPPRSALPSPHPMDSEPRE